ncbi:6633_t:CDS:2, partial [Funneliformis geosporum]
DISDDKGEVKDKLVIKIDQDDDHASKFSVADDISEVYSLSRIHECINGQKPLRAMINIDALEEDMEITVITISSDSSKCSYHILYAPVLLIDHHKLKAFTKLVYTITGEKYDNGWNELDHAKVQSPTSLELKVRPRMLILQKYSTYLKDWTIKEKDEENFNSNECEEIFECDPSIAEKIQQKNKNFLQFSYKKKYVRPLPNEGDIYVESSWEMKKTYILKNLAIPNNVNLLVLFTRHSYSNAVTTRLNLKSYCDIDVSIIAQAQSRLIRQSIEKLYKLIQEAKRIIVMDNDLTDLNIEWIKTLHKNIPFFIIHNTYQPQKGKTFRLAPNKESILVELWDYAKQTSLLPFENHKSASLICHLRKDLQGIVHAFKTEFSELRIKEYHGKSDLMEKAQDFSNVEES